MKKNTRRERARDDRTTKKETREKRAMTTSRSWREGEKNTRTSTWRAETCGYALGSHAPSNTTSIAVTLSRDWRTSTHSSISRRPIAGSPPSPIETTWRVRIRRMNHDAVTVTRRARPPAGRNRGHAQGWSGRGKLTNDPQPRHGWRRTRKPSATSPTRDSPEAHLSNGHDARGARPPPSPASFASAVAVATPPSLNGNWSPSPCERPFLCSSCRT